MLLKGLQTRLPPELLPPVSSEQKVKRKEPSRSVNRYAVQQSSDKASSISSVGSYLGIKLKLSLIEESHHMNETSLPVSRATTPEHKHRIAPHRAIFEEDQLDQPVSSSVLSVSSGPIGYIQSTPPQKSEALCNVIELSPTGLPNS